MALTHSLAGLQSALDTFNTAVQGEAWRDAWKAFVAYQATYAGLVSQGSADGAATGSFPDPKELRETLVLTQRESLKAGDRRRLGRVGVSRAQA